MSVGNVSLLSRLRCERGLQEWELALLQYKEVRTPADMNKKLRLPSCEVVNL